MGFRGRARLGCAGVAATVVTLLACAAGEDSGAGDVGVPSEGGAGRDVVVIPDPEPDAASGQDTGAKPGPDSGACTGKVVINELQTHGAGATVEFIELFNPGVCAVPLGDWRIAYKSSAGTGNGVLLKLAVGESIAAKGYLLFGTALFTPATPVTFTAGMADDGQISLQDETLKTIDSVGYGSATGPFIETNPAPGPPVGGSIGRSPNGADTDDNSADFKTFAIPSPGVAN